ncbi:hypothetical protein ACFL59_00450 [Planctomycetota bacterium]
MVAEEGERVQGTFTKDGRPIAIDTGIVLVSVREGKLRMRLPDGGNVAVTARFARFKEVEGGVCFEINTCTRDPRLTHPRDEVTDDDKCAVRVRAPP